MEELESFPDDVFPGESGCSEYDDVVNRAGFLGRVHRVIGYGFRETTFGVEEREIFCGRKVFMEVRDHRQ